MNILKKLIKDFNRRVVHNNKGILGLAMGAAKLGMSAYGAYQKSKGSSGGQLMQAGNILAPEDKWAAGARKENYDRISGMMGNVDQGIDPLQNRRDQQLQHALTGIRRDMYGTPGDRNQSISGMGQQQMALFGSNPAAMAAARRKDRRYMQTQMGDERQRIGDAGTDYIERMSMWGPEMMNKLRTGREVSGTYGPMMIPGQSGGGMDMDGISGMMDQVKGVAGDVSNAWGNYREGRGASSLWGSPQQGPLLPNGQFQGRMPQGQGQSGGTIQDGRPYGTIQENGVPMSGYFNQ